MDEDRDRGAGERGAPEFLGEHHGAERVHLGAAVFGGVADAEEAEFAHPAQHLARHEALLLPLLAVRLDLLLDEAARPERAAPRALFAEIGEGGRRIRGGSSCFRWRFQWRRAGVPPAGPVLAILTSVRAIGASRVPRAGRRHLGPARREPDDALRPRRIGWPAPSPHPLSKPLSRRRRTRPALGFGRPYGQYAAVPQGRAGRRSGREGHRVSRWRCASTHPGRGRRRAGSRRTLPGWRLISAPTSFVDANARIGQAAR